MSIDPDLLNEMMGLVHDLCWYDGIYEYDSLTNDEWYAYPWDELHYMNLIDIGEHREPDGDRWISERYIKPTATGIAYIEMNVLPY